MTDGPRLAPFDPLAAPAVVSTNGHRARRRWRISAGVAFGFLAGALCAATLVGRLQWLNLTKVGWWGRPVIAGAVAGAVAGAMRRDGARAGAAAGALAASFSLLLVYGLVRAGNPVLWVEESAPRRIASDAGLLIVLGAGGGAFGAVAAVVVRGAFARSRRR